MKPSVLTVRDWLTRWLDNVTAISVSPKTLERYRQLVDVQITLHLGALALQKLRPSHIAWWHANLLKDGRSGGGALSARTVGHAHRVLSKALGDAAKIEIVPRNVALGLSPPAVEEREIEILTPDQIGELLAKIDGHVLKPLVVTALGTGLRRGELCALRWSRVDLDAGTLRVEESLEETKKGLRFKAPKSRNGRRTVSLPPTVVDALRAHRRARLEFQVALGLGKLSEDALVFCRPDGTPMSPDKLSWDWRRVVSARKLPKVTFHALRHSHVSALINSGLDVFSVSRRIGHGSAALTLRTYTHLFTSKDAQAADAIEAALTR